MRRRALGVLAFCCCGLAGCATTEPSLPVGHIAVIAARFPPEPEIGVLAQGKGAAAQKMGGGAAIEGGVAGAIVPLQLGPFYPLVAPFTILAGALIGGVAGSSYGLLNGLPSDQATAVNDVVDRAMAEIEIQEQVPRRLEELLQHSRYRASYVRNEGPTQRSQRLEYPELLAHGFDGVLELSVASVGIVSTKGEPRRIALEVKMRSRTLCKTGCVSGERIVQYASRPRILADWSAAGGQLLQEEMTRSYETLTRYVTEIYFPSVITAAEQRPDESPP